MFESCASFRSLRGAGLAAAVAVAASAGAQSPPTIQRIECRGSDPAWRLDVGPTSAVYSSQGPRAKREVVFRGSLQGVATLAPPVVVWRGDSTHLPRETLVVTLREEACKLAATDAAAATHRAILSLRAGEVVVGCCDVRTAAPAAAPKRNP